MIEAKIKGLLFHDYVLTEGSKHLADIKSTWCKGLSIQVDDCTYQYKSGFEGTSFMGELRKEKQEIFSITPALDNAYIHNFALGNDRFGVDLPPNSRHGTFLKNGKVVGEFSLNKRSYSLKIPEDLPVLAKVGCFVGILGLQG